MRVIISVCAATLLLATAGCKRPDATEPGVPSEQPPADTQPMPQPQTSPDTTAPSDTTTPPSDTTTPPSTEPAPDTTNPPPPNQ
jgi:hypothetical protein